MSLHLSSTPFFNCLAFPLSRGGNQNLPPSLLYTDSYVHILNYPKNVGGERNHFFFLSDQKICAKHLVNRIFRVSQGKENSIMDKKIDLK